LTLSVVFLLPAGYLRADSCLQEEKCALAASRDNLDRLYRDANNSLTILERSHRFTMADLITIVTSYKSPRMNSFMLGNWCQAKILSSRICALPKDQSSRS
jgi:hypothetical protein